MTNFFPGLETIISFLKIVSSSWTRRCQWPGLAPMSSPTAVPSAPCLRWDYQRAGARLEDGSDHSARPVCVQKCSQDLPACVLFLNTWMMVDQLKAIFRVEHATMVFVTCLNCFCVKGNAGLRQLKQVPKAHNALCIQDSGCSIHYYPQKPWFGMVRCHN